MMARRWHSFSAICDWPVHFVAIKQDSTEILEGYLKGCVYSPLAPYLSTPMAVRVKTDTYTVTG